MKKNKMSWLIRLYWWWLTKVCGYREIGIEEYKNAIAKRIGKN